jgi:hypothetical protein
MPDETRLVVEIPPDMAFAHCLAGVAKTLAERLGMGSRENLRFQLTVEELCMYLAGVARDGHPMRIELTGKRHLLKAAFGFEASELALGGLNITACPKPGQGAETPDDIGLLLAGKAADRFFLEHQGGDRFRIVAEVDRAYPSLPPVRPPETSRPPYRLLAEHDPARLTQAAALASVAYPAWQCPGSFRTPEKFADLVACGQVECLVAVDAGGQTAGLATWSPCSDRAIYFSGPFLFAPGTQRADLARLLLDGMLMALARTPHVILLSFRATEDLTPGYFEPLGDLQGAAEAGGGRQPVVFRHLREDAGLAVWCSPRIETFLHQCYDRLEMFRDLLPVEEPPVRARAESLLGATLDRQRDLAELQAFLDGRDMAANLAAHVNAIRGKGIGRILFYMDLSRPWEAALAEDLMHAGFVPKLVLPYAGQADKVVWQHDRIS